MNKWEVYRWFPVYSHWYKTTELVFAMARTARHYWLIYVIKCVIEPMPEYTKHNTILLSIKMFWEIV